MWFWPTTTTELSWAWSESLLEDVGIPDRERWNTQDGQGPCWWCNFSGTALVPCSPSQLLLRYETSRQITTVKHRKTRGVHARALHTETTSSYLNLPHDLFESIIEGFCVFDEQHTKSTFRITSNMASSRTRHTNPRCSSQAALRHNQCYSEQHHRRCVPTRPLTGGISLPVSSWIQTRIRALFT